MSWLDAFFLQYRTVENNSVALPQRASTNFVGFSVTDDAVNDATIISGGSGSAAVVFSDSVSGTNSNLIGNRTTSQGTIDNTKSGVVQLGSDTSGVASGVTANYATVGGGDRNSATGTYATVPGGLHNTASGSGSMAVGNGNTASGTNSVAFGLSNTSTAAQGAVFGTGHTVNSLATNSFCEGNGNSLGAGATAAHAEGSSNAVGGANAHGEGTGSTANGAASHAEGTSTASGTRSHSEGQGNASGTNCHAEGVATAGPGSNCHAEGNSSATADQAHSEGFLTTASGNSSHAEGNSCTSSGAASHAEGTSCTSAGAASHAQNHNCLSPQDYSTAMGENAKTTLKTSVAHSGGHFTADGDSQTEQVVIRGEALSVGGSALLVFSDLANQSITLENGCAYYLILETVGYAKTSLDYAIFRTTYAVTQEGGTVTAPLIDENRVKGTTTAQTNWTIVATAAAAPARVVVTASLGGDGSNSDVRFTCKATLVKVARAT